MNLAESLRGPARFLLGTPFSIGVYIYYRSLAYFAAHRPKVQRSYDKDSPDFPIDVVYTWVDDSDRNWQANKSHHTPTLNASYSKTADHRTRFHNRDELRFSLRSLAAYAHFVNRIYIVTDDQVPAWLNLNHPQIVLISHKEILPAEVLPTFNSHAIEARLHHIPGLSEHYIYFNDDVFLGRPANVNDYFTSSGLTVNHLSNQTVPDSEPLDTDTDLVWSMKNNRRLIQDSFGVTITRKLAHVPHSQRRSILFEMEEVYEEHFTRTIRNRFRNIRDISVSSALYPYYAHHARNCILREPRNNPYRYAYINSASPFLKPFLTRIYLGQDFDSFCVNEPISDVDTSPFDSIIGHFLQSYYPSRCQFEVC